jgi:arsenate reductase
MKIYGIKNCDTMKKTLRWFDTNNATYEFVDYKKSPPTEALAKAFLKAHSWEIIVNKRGTTWRKLDEETKDSMDQQKAVALILEHPSIIKRPIIENDGQFFVGYDESTFEQLI